VQRRLSAIGAGPNHQLTQENDMLDQTTPPPKPTIADIVMDCPNFTISKDYMADVLVPKARAHYPDMPPEHLEALVLAEAIAWNEQLDGDQFWADFEVAAALDPDWYETGNHSTSLRDGALHDTPQKLVAAYRAWHDATLPVEKLLKAVGQRAIDASGVNRRTFDPDRPGDVDPVATVMMQLMEEHPRRDELLTFAAEEARREGKLG
jgi:hypothetical protein